MMTKNRTQFVFIIAAGLSLISGFSQTADIEIPDDSSEGKTAKVENSHITTTAMAIAKTAAIAVVVMPIVVEKVARVRPEAMVLEGFNKAVVGIPVSLLLLSLVVVAERHGYRLFEKDWNKEDARERHLSAQKRRRECKRKRQQEFESKFFEYFGGAINNIKARNSK